MITLPTLPPGLRPRLLLLLLASTSTAYAQTPTVTSLSPVRNARSAPQATNVSVDFSQALSSNAATLGALKVFSQQTGGKKAGTATVSGNTLSFDPSSNFKGGETVFATVTSAAQSSSGTPAAPQVFQFTAATTPSPATFSPSTQTVEGFALNAYNFILSDLDGNGALDVLCPVANTNTGSSGAVGIRFNNGDGTFGGFRTASVAIDPSKVVTGDLDGDGDLDLITAGSIYPTRTYRISVRFNDGAGSFSGTQQFVVGDNTTDLILGDVDADGDLDLLTCNSATVSVRLNNGSGGFSGNQEVPINASGASAIVLGDVDNDGDLDFATANGNTGISIRLNNGSGSFGTGQDVRVGSQVTELATGDVDADGDLDIVTAGTNAAGSVTVLLNTGAGTFAPGQNLALGASSTKVALGDLDGDNDLDLMSSVNDGVRVRLNNGSGTFSGTQALLAGANVRTALLGDLDGDGDLDILAGANSITGLSVLQNQPAPSTTSITPDVATTRNTVTITGSDLLGTTGVTFNGVVAPTYTVKSNTQLLVAVPDGATTGPVVVNSLVGNSNGLPFTVTPIAVVTSVTPTRNTFLAPRRTPIAATFNQPLGTGFDASQAIRVFSQESGRKAGQATVSGSTLSFVPTTDFKAGETLYASVTATAQSSAGSAVKPHVFQFTTATTPSSATFATGANLALYTHVDNVVPGDVDGDGDTDLLVTTNSSEGLPKVTTYLNNGSGAFTSATQLTLRGSYISLEMGDIDGDGDLDLVVPNNGLLNGQLDTYLNNGQGTFTLVAGSAANLISIGQFSLRDADGDGDLDIFTTGYSGVVVYFNNGSGTFSNPRSTPVGVGAKYLAIGDLDNDGDLDVISAPYSYLNTASVRFNDGLGTFTGTQELPISILPNDADLGDIDGDGDLDFVVASNSTKAVDIRLNNGAGVFSGTGSVPVGKGGQPARVYLRDIDGDGDLDILTSSTDNSVSIRLNDGKGNFSGNQEIPAGNNPYYFFVRDTDNDGDLDFITTSYDVVQVQVNGANSLLVTSVNPSRNARAAQRDVPIGATFSQNIANSTATRNSLKVFSQQAGGLLPSQPLVSNSFFVFTPTTNFKPGEKVSVTITRGVETSTGQNLANPQVYQFTTAVAPSPGNFIGGSDTPGGGRLAVGDLDGDKDLDYVTFSGAVRLNDGTGVYTAGQQVSFNGLPRNVALSDVDGDGDLDLLLSVNNGQGIVYVRLNNGSANFSGTQQVLVGQEPYGLAVGDVDADGDIDLITSNGSSSSVSVRFNDGLGNFTGTTVVTVNSQPTSVALGDIDNDGDLDLLVGNYNTYTVSVRLNNGLGGFSGNQEVTVGLNPNNLALGDVDGDGDLDFVTSNFNTYVNNQRRNGNVSVVLNNGLGTFRESQQVALSGTPLDVTLGDVDGDGDLDIVTANGGDATDATASVRLNNGTGTFAGTQEVLVSLRPGSVVLADADGDGDLDLYTGGNTSTSLRLNQPDTSFLVLREFSPTRNSSAAPRTAPITATFNQIMSPSVVNQNALRVFGTQSPKAGSTTVNGNTISFAQTNGFKPGETVFTTVTSSSRSTTNQTLLTPQIFQFTAATALATAAFTVGSDPSLGSNPQAVVAGDVDGDGDLDLLSVSYITGGQVNVRLNNGNGTFRNGQDIRLGYNPYHLALGDIDGDGDLDLVTANAGGPEGFSSVCFNNGAGLFSSNYEVPVGINPHAVALADVDADGDLDLLAANYVVRGNTTSSSVSVRLNNGTGAFSGTQEVSVGTRPVSLALGDVDGDGDLDLFTANSNTNTVSLRLNDSKGIFSGTTEISVPYNPETLTLGDIDKDGDLDLLVANTASNSVSVRLNNSLGVFSGTVQISDLRAPRGLALGDVNGDSYLDLLVANSANNTVSVRLNTGSGFFGINAPVRVDDVPTGLTLGDFDGNGTLDFATSNLGNSTASIRLNTPVSAKVLASANASLTAQVELYPNPAHTSVQLHLPAELTRQPVQISLLNSLGQVVLEQQLATGQNAPELKLGQLARGLYNVQLRTTSGLVVKRLAVE
ncbi:FG-GAP-like repeat-containing protein [Hymenobacter sp. GOD-10R]|uniref:FG-GAP-like repeat-containing protein n=1 Tax=Hymenobacter sp. GOD-10R TaxID=3093922 RepID=UPI002D788437|nr:FG-GAP-like repeat-containing protein [Hymenobacter sp. GOD-10R]WRQ27029.1 FG-GAP-like repeat-containing protein [Hymenobacter sp. GOD-10R]